MSTSTISFKLFFIYRSANKADPGVLIQDMSIPYKEQILLNIPQERICCKCRVIRTDRTVHCPVKDSCIDRYDQFSTWANTSIGRGNHGLYFAFVFYFWLDVFLVGWIDARSILVTECDLPDNQTCPLDFLCVGQLCHSMILHFFSTLFGATICLGLFVPSLVVCLRHTYYFGINKTTFQKKGPHYIDMCYYDENIIGVQNILSIETDSVIELQRTIEDAHRLSYGDIEIQETKISEENLIIKNKNKKTKKAKKQGCCANYNEMTCKRKIRSQNMLYVDYIL